MKTKAKWYFIILTSLVITLTMCNIACSESSEKQEIIDFIDDSSNSAIFERALIVMDDWNMMMEKAHTYTRSQFIQEIGLLEKRAGISYREMSEIVPPKCLRDFWDKEVEASKLYYQAISLAYQIKDDPNINQNQINELVFTANDLKTEAIREFEDICEKNDIDISW